MVWHHGQDKATPVVFGTLTDLAIRVLWRGRVQAGAGLGFAAAQVLPQGGGFPGAPRLGFGLCARSQAGSGRRLLGHDARL